jgi:hypothetical protein
MRWHRPNCGGHWGLGLGAFGLCRLSVGCVGPIRPLTRPLTPGVSGGGSKHWTRIATHTAETAEATAMVTQSTRVVRQHGREAGQLLCRDLLLLRRYYGGAAPELAAS